MKCGNVGNLAFIVFTKFPNQKNRNENELNQDNQSYKDRYKVVECDTLCKIKKREPYLDTGYKKLQNFNFVQADEVEENAEFSVINPDLLHLDLEVSDSVTNAPALSTIFNDLLLSNEKFYEIC